MGGAVHLLAMLAWLGPAVVAFRCDRTPEAVVTAKSPVDNRFQLKISGSPEKYVPGEGYIVSLVGQRLPGQGQVPQKFVGFSLVVEGQNPAPLRVLSARTISGQPWPVGTFTLYDDSMTKFSPTCPNMVTHTSPMPKAEVQVRWSAPPPGSGCIIFRATVVEQKDVWYQDDGPLSKILCEDVQENLDSQPEVLDHCCACDEAKFEVTFEGLWSRHTHPRDFPSNSWLTRFSDIIGASHSPNYKFWEYGGFASEGLRQVAERGSTRVLESELKSHSNDIRTIIKARGISYPNVTGKTFAVFRVNREHHLMSLVSMIDPSPDWIVGVSALELCLRNCSWVDGMTLNLYPWDAGTDSGMTYISPDQQTYPREKIRRITSSFPNDPASPFYDSSGAEMKPLSRLYLTRQRLYEKTCSNEPSSETPEGCEVTEWTKWSACSQECGRGGTQTRHRRYRRKNKCPQSALKQSRPCEGHNCRSFRKESGEEKEYPPNCDVHEWTDWSRCDAIDNDCKRGTQRRYRVVKHKGQPKYCININTEEEKPCQPSMHPSTCPKTFRGKWKEERDDQVYGNGEGNETTDQDFPDENGEQTTVEGEETNGDNDNEHNLDEEGNDRNTKGMNVEDENNKANNEIENGEKHEGQNGEEDEEQNGKEKNDEGGNGIDEENNNEVDEKGEEDGKGNDEAGGGETDDEEANNEVNKENNDTDDYDRSFKKDLEPSEQVKECAMTKWSRWSACSVTCGTGEHRRERRLLHERPRAEPLRAAAPIETDYGLYDDEEAPPEYAPEPCSMYKVLEVEKCTGTYPSCLLSSDEARADDGDHLTTEDGTEDEVLETRGQIVDVAEEGTERPVRNCRFSRWTAWSECEAPCNEQGFKKRTRYIEIHAKNGGLACAGKTIKQKRCFRRCPDNERGKNEEREKEDTPIECKYGDWSRWSECTATCGLSSLRQRTRLVTAGSLHECLDRVRKEPCNVAACPR